MTGMTLTMGLFSLRAAKFVAWRYIPYLALAPAYLHYCIIALLHYFAMIITSIFLCFWHGSRNCGG